MPKIAAVRFPSPLPQLDREYDYLIAEGMSLEVGSLVEVPFGSGKKAKSGVVVELKEDSSHKGELGSITQVLSVYPQTSAEILELCNQVAKRQASTVGEILASALPKRFIRVEKKISPLERIESEASPGVSLLDEALHRSKRVHNTPCLVAGGDGIPCWALDFAYAAKRELQAGKSSLVILPDYREVRHFELALEHLGLSEFSLKHVSTDVGSARYGNHLVAQISNGINYGTRTACFTAIKDLGLIMLWDDGDESHIEQGSPYWNSRDVLLQRQQVEDTQLVIASHLPSSESLRLIELNYLVASGTRGTKPLVRITDSYTRLDDETFALVSKCLSDGRPVLIQIANLGWASAIACSNCKELRKCPNCQSGVWIDPAGMYRCRSCKQSALLPPCTCGSTNTRPVRIGASAIADQFRRSFPKTTILESNGDNPLLSTTASGVLVVATPGSEPDVVGGYDLIVIADAAQMIGAPRLRALEKAVGSWANAISLASKQSLVIFVGLSGVIADQIKDLDFEAIVSADFQDRVSLGLPPSTRVASVISSNQTDFNLLREGLRKAALFDRLRFLPNADKLSLVLDYQYSDGPELADLLRSLTNLLTAQSKHKKPGERVYRINMDDSKVI